MYIPKYSISNRVLKNIGIIEAAREVIDNAPLIPSYEKQFKTDAMVRTIYHGTHIEGNDLSLIQTQKVLEGEEVFGRERDVQEVINYRNVVKLLEEMSREETYNLEQLKRIQKETVYRLIADEARGVVRTTQVIVKEEGTGRIILTPPTFVEVPYLLDDFFAWLNSPEGKDTHPVVKAGITHYVLVAVHPFIEGNGRSARAFASLVMLKEGYDVKKFFAIEEHLDKDVGRYYEALGLVDRQAKDVFARDLTPWLEYFSEVVAVELNKIKEKIRKLSIDSRLKLKIGQQVALTERQVQLVEIFSDQGSAFMSDIKPGFPMVSEDTILRDLKYLIEKGIIAKEGSTKAAKYVLVSSGK